MLKFLLNPWRKWRASRHASHQLDAILAQFEPTRSLAERNEWLIELAYWLRRADRPVGTTSESWRYARLRYLLQVLENNPDLAARVGQTLRTIVQDNDPVSLLCDTGLSSRSGFWGELVDRWQARFLPPAPNEPQLAALFALLFVGPHDAAWVDSLDDELVTRLHALFRAGLSDADELTGQTRLERSLGIGIQILISQVRAAGLSRAIRSRMDHEDVTELPFYRLADAANAIFLERPDAPPARPEQLAQQLNYFRAVLDQCRTATASVYQHLDENGVSVEVVFQVERMKAWLGRIDLLLTAWADTRATRRFTHLTAELVSASQHRRSVGYLVRATFADLARKVVERSAESGEHYITRDKKEYGAMVKAAAGGGVITAATVYVKFFIAGAHLSRFTEGFFASINYAVSFLGIHFAHFTLATKQPAMTAPALAHRLDQVARPEGLERFVDDTVAMIRTNAAAIAGNLVAVAPVAFLVQWLAGRFFHANLISPEKAVATIDSFSILGPTPLYAIFTGVLLWASSLAAGWADNWFALHRVHDVIAYHRRLRFMVGTRGAQRIAGFWKRNLSGIVANVSLGFMLGLGPEIVSFFGPHMEVRHVTLSTGAVATAVGVLGPSVMHTAPFWLAVAGIALMGVLNVMVSFALAFNMAMRSRNLRGLDRKRITGAVWRRILRDPLCLLVPRAPTAATPPGTSTPA
ncbi:recombinase [Ralstonia insidiosa]|jgi:site-specific recombinase|uniref:site-specific recombinase n=1 Tax=Ralstonia TaxID=48736 RepID=UPI00066487F0|nr:recombinase [Ralstonia insidiosa]KMW49015.1 recombinase [Ralstonia sp. MD27]MBX3772175.1 recombinase [Ralstonia pickettii]NOZ15455.1 recombinase [Betaproteobacteria bacterium]MBA9856213.1 recombinase [Ralstonia insidiosa]MBA9870433.1 recombinase [Ralstonia insidiosa]